MKRKHLKENTIKKEKQNKLKFVLCIVGMIVLVIVAFFLPQFIFNVQDMYQFQGARTEERSSLYSAQRSQAYETDLNTRICNFLNLSDITVTTIDYEFTDDTELSELLDDIFNQDWFYLLYDHMILTTFYYYEHFMDSFDVELLDSKKMLIHEQDYRNGVTLMMWYLDLYLTDIDTRIRLLVDTETETIYYFKLTSEPLDDESIVYLLEKYGYNDVKALLEKYGYDSGYSKEFVYSMAEIGRSYYNVYFKYYEADDVSPFNEFEFSYNESSVGEFWESDEKYWFLDYIVDENYCEMTAQLPYENLCVQFQLIATPSEGIYPNLEMGLRNIAEHIPEMLQD